MSYLRRLKMEWRDMITEPPPLCYAEPNGENILQWNAILMGPPSSPYKGTAIFLRIDLPEEYPFKPPRFLFTTRIFHPNVL